MIWEVSLSQILQSFEIGLLHPHEIYSSQNVGFDYLMDQYLGRLNHVTFAV